MTFSAKPEDDEYHAFNAQEWWTVETVWFAFTVPEKSLNVVIYLVMRPAMGVCTFQVNIFDTSGQEPWNNRHWRSLWHLPLPKSLNPIEMPEVGFRLDVIKPLTEYRLRYAYTNARFDVTWSALVPPRMAGADHIDQFGRVTGELELDGEAIQVDCLQMRDRSWKRRSDLEGRMGAYTYGLASEASAFLMPSSYVGDHSVCGGGWLLRDGRMVDLVRGVRRVTRRGPDGRPLKIEIEAEDKDGRAFAASGETVCRSVMHTCGNILAWDSVVNWQFDEQNCWGEDQDVYRPQDWGLFPTATS